MVEAVDPLTTDIERAVEIIGKIQLEVISLRTFLTVGGKEDEAKMSLNAIVLLAADLSEADGEAEMKKNIFAEFSGKGTIRVKRRSKLKIDMKSFFENVDAELARGRVASAESTPREEVPVVEIPVEGEEVAEKVGEVVGKIIG